MYYLLKTHLFSRYFSGFSFWLWSDSCRYWTTL